MRLKGVLIGISLLWLAVSDSFASEHSIADEVNGLNLSTEEFISIAVDAIGYRGRTAIRREGAVFDYMVVDSKIDDADQNYIVDYLNAVLIEVSELSNAEFTSLEFSQSQIAERMEASVSHLFIVFGREAETERLIGEAYSVGPNIDLKFPAHDHFSQNWSLIGTILHWIVGQVAFTDYLPGCVMEFYRTGDGAIQEMFSYVSLDVDQRHQRECVNAIVLKSIGVQGTTAELVQNSLPIEDSNPRLTDLTRAIVRSIYSPSIEFGDTAQSLRQKLNVVLVD